MVVFGCRGAEERQATETQRRRGPQQTSPPERRVSTNCDTMISIQSVCIITRSEIEVKGSLARSGNVRRPCSAEQQ